MAAPQVFYTIPKEKIVNLIGKPADFLPDGSVTVDYDAFVRVVLADYQLPQRIVVSPTGIMGSVVVGTRAELISRGGFPESYYGDAVPRSCSAVVTILKEWEL